MKAKQIMKGKNTMKLNTVKTTLKTQFIRLVKMLDSLQWNVDLQHGIMLNINIALENLDEIENKDDLATWWLTLNKIIFWDIITLTSELCIKQYTRIENYLDKYWLESK